VAANLSNSQSLDSRPRPVVLHHARTRGSRQLSGASLVSHSDMTAATDVCTSAGECSKTAPFNDGRSSVESVSDIVFYTNKTPPKPTNEFSQRSREVVRGGLSSQRADRNAHTEHHTRYDIAPRMPAPWSTYCIVLSATTRGPVGNHAVP
jgi:hypothetical protein